MKAGSDVSAGSPAGGSQTGNEFRDVEPQLLGDTAVSLLAHLALPDYYCSLLVRIWFTPFLSQWAAIKVSLIHMHTNTQSCLSLSDISRN